MVLIPVRGRSQGPAQPVGNRIAPITDVAQAVQGVGGAFTQASRQVASAAGDLLARKKKEADEGLLFDAYTQSLKIEADARKGLEEFKGRDAGKQAKGVSASYNQRIDKEVRDNLPEHLRIAFRRQRDRRQIAFQRASDQYVKAQTGIAVKAEFKGGVEAAQDGAVAAVAFGYLGAITPDAVDAARANVDASIEEGVGLIRTRAKRLGIDGAQMEQDWYTGTNLKVMEQLLDMKQPEQARRYLETVRTKLDPTGLQDSKMEQRIGKALEVDTMDEIIVSTLRLAEAREKIKPEGPSSVAIAFKIINEKLARKEINASQWRQGVSGTLKGANEKNAIRRLAAAPHMAALKSQWFKTNGLDKSSPSYTILDPQSRSEVDEDYDRFLRTRRGEGRAEAREKREELQFLRRRFDVMPFTGNPKRDQTSADLQSHPDFKGADPDNLLVIEALQKKANERKDSAFGLGETEFEESVDLALGTSGELELGAKLRPGSNAFKLDQIRKGVLTKRMKQEWFNWVKDTARNKDLLTAMPNEEFERIARRVFSLGKIAGFGSDDVKFFGEVQGTPDEKLFWNEDQRDQNIRNYRRWGWDLPDVPDEGFTSIPNPQEGTGFLGDIKPGTTAPFREQVFLQSPNSERVLAFPKGSNLTGYKEQGWTETSDPRLPQAPAPAPAPAPAEEEAK